MCTIHPDTLLVDGANTEEIPTTCLHDGRTRRNDESHYLYSDDLAASGCDRPLSSNSFLCVTTFHVTTTTRCATSLSSPLYYRQLESNNQNCYRWNLDDHTAVSCPEVVREAVSWKGVFTMLGAQSSGSAVCFSLFSLLPLLCAKRIRAEGLDLSCMRA